MSRCEVKEHAFSNPSAICPYVGLNASADFMLFFTTFLTLFVPHFLTMFSSVHLTLKM